MIVDPDPFNAIADPRRRELLEALRDGELPVNTLVERVGPDQPSVSKALRVLRVAGLVHVRRDGRQRLYSVNRAAMKPLADWAGAFDAHWTTTLNAIKARAEACADDDPSHTDRTES